jgi:hypothetical protein
MMMTSGSTVAKVKVQGPQSLVERVVDALGERLAAVKTSRYIENTHDEGVHCFLVVTEGGLEILEEPV